MAETPKASEVPKEKSMQQQIADGVAEALKTAIPAAIMASLQAQDAVKAGIDAARAAAKDAGGECGECHQRLKACQGKHVQMCVFPHDEAFGRFFRGIGLNGVWYLSNGPGHMVTVPAVNDIPSQITFWEKTERELAHGKSRQFQSGILSGTHGAIQANLPMY